MARVGGARYGHGQGLELQTVRGAIWSGHREYRCSYLGFETREWSWCGDVILLERRCNVDEARASQREDAKQRKENEASLSSPVVFGELR
ncbi:hypothetical protein FF2_008788 [Malus domestica]